MFQSSYGACTLAVFNDIFCRLLFEILTQSFVVLDDS